MLYIRESKKTSIINGNNSGKRIVYICLVLLCLVNMMVSAQENPLLVDCGIGKSGYNLAAGSFFSLDSNEWMNVQTGEMIAEKNLSDILFVYPDSKAYYLTGTVLKISSYILLAAGCASICTSYLPAIEDAQVKRILGNAGILTVMLSGCSRIGAADSRRKAVQKYNRHILERED